MGFYGDAKFDAIVIGAGLGGLSCALHLAKKGLKILVVEKQPKVGGYAQNFRRGPYQFDASLHIAPSLTPGQGLANILEYLQIFDKLTIVEHKPMFRATFPDRHYDLPGGQTAVNDFLSAEFPNERAGIHQFTNICQEIVSANYDLFWGNPVDITNYFPAQYFRKTYTQLLNECHLSAKIQGILGQLWQSTGLPNDRCAANWAIEVMGCHLLSGNYYIKGGGGVLSEIMANTLEENGGTLLTNALTTKILLENRHVTGIELADGRQFSAPIVISNAGPLQTYKYLLPAGQVAAPFLNKISNYESSCSLLTLYIGLDKPAESLGLACHSEFFNNSYDNNKAYRLALNEQYDQTDFMVSSYTDHEALAHPAGHGIMQMLEIAPGQPWCELDSEHYRQKKQQVKKQLLQKLAQKFPDVIPHITTCDLATPRTLSAITRNAGGAVYGWAQTPEQADIYRFANSGIMRGLYFAGAWGRGGGGGYMGSLINGRVAAREILQKEGFDGPDVAFKNYPPLQQPPATTTEPEQQLTLTADDLSGSALSMTAFIKYFNELREQLATNPTGEIVHLTIMAVPGQKLSPGQQIILKLKAQIMENGKPALLMTVKTADNRKLGHINAVLWQKNDG